MPNAELAPAAAAASRMRSISGSLMNGNDRRHADPDRDARTCQGFDRLQAAVWCSGAWLEDARQGRIERGDGDIDGRQAAFCHRPDQIEIALDAG